MIVHKFVVYSGGMDSFTLLNHVDAELNTHKDTETLTAISFNYGQRHSKELAYAAAVCKELHIPQICVDLTGLTRLLSNSSLTNSSIAVPEGHYEAESMKQTVVPGRNTIMLAIAMGIAENAVLTTALEGQRARALVYYGAHSGDHHIYPDCRPEFYATMQDAFEEATNRHVSLVAPYINGDKKTILAIGDRLGLDYGKSWTCYKGEERPCGVCGSCQERGEAFAAMGMIDPLTTL